MDLQSVNRIDGQILTMHNAAHDTEFHAVAVPFVISPQGTYGTLLMAVSLRPTENTMATYRTIFLGFGVGVVLVGALLTRLLMTSTFAPRPSRRVMPVAIVTIIGLALAAGAAFLYRRGTNDDRLSSAEGRVVAVGDDNVRGEHRFVATIDWTDATQRAHAYSANAANASTFTKGERVPLRYDPAHPDDDVHIAGSGGYVIAAAFPGVLALILLFVAVSEWGRLLRRRG